PVEVMSVINGAGSTYYLRVGLHSGPAPHEIKLMVLDNGAGAHFTMAGITNTNDGTVYGHAAAADAIAVGAASFVKTPAFGVNPPQIETYSSGGPTKIVFDAAGNALATPDLRQTPQITAPDGGNTTFFFADTSADTDSLPNFFGTSAAAPDAAAVAALMLQARSTLSA